MKTAFEVEWEARYISHNKKYCYVQTKEELFRPSQLKKDGEPYKGAKKHKIKAIDRIYHFLAKHIVLVHNLWVRQNAVGEDGFRQVINEHIDLKVVQMKDDIEFYLGMAEAE